MRPPSYGSSLRSIRTAPRLLSSSSGAWWTSYGTIRSSCCCRSNIRVGHRTGGAASYFSSCSGHIHGTSRSTYHLHPCSRSSASRPTAKTRRSSRANRRATRSHSNAVQGPMTGPYRTPRALRSAYRNALVIVSIHPSTRSRTSIRRSASTTIYWSGRVRSGSRASRRSTASRLRTLLATNSYRRCAWCFADRQLARFSVRSSWHASNGFTSSGLPEPRIAGRGHQRLKYGCQMPDRVTARTFLACRDSTRSKGRRGGRWGPTSGTNTTGRTKDYSCGGSRRSSRATSGCRGRRRRATGYSSRCTRGSRYRSLGGPRARCSRSATGKTAGTRRYSGRPTAAG